MAHALCLNFFIVIIAYFSQLVFKSAKQSDIQVNPFYEPQNHLAKRKKNKVYSSKK